MSSAPAIEIFTFTWSIENFSMCPQKSKEKLNSPVFVVDVLDETQWRLLVYPKGDSDDNSVSCYLQNVSGSPGLLTYRLELLYGYEDSTGSVKRIENQTFNNQNSTQGYSIFLSTEAMREKFSLLGNSDTLTFQCVLSICDYYDLTDVTALSVKSIRPSTCTEEDDYELLERVSAIASVQLDPHLQQCFPSRCFARTRIQVDRRSIIWKIERFSSLIAKPGISIPVVTALGEYISLILTMYVDKDSDNDDCIQIEIGKNYKDISVRNFVRCKVTLLNAQMNDSVSNDSDYFFEPDKKGDVWKFPTFIKIEKLGKEKNLYLKDDVLSVRFDFSISVLEGEHHLDSFTLFPSDCHVRRDSSTGELNSDFEHLYEDGKFCDVTLCAGDRNFPAHRIVLSARSPVFSAMFERDTKEKETGVVVIEDIDPDTLSRMLVYTYTDNLDALDPDSAVLLYAAANKYRIASLKQLCSSYLISTLSVVNVCEVLTLADLHSDDNLMKCVQKFMLATPDGCFHSIEWKKLMVNNPKLASEAMYKVLVEKAYF